MKFIRYLRWAVFLCFLLLAESMSVSAAGKQTIYNSPYVSFSPDKKAWTTNAGDANYSWYSYGFTVETGISSSLREPGTGEHFYNYTRQGTVPVGNWVVAHRPATCIHGAIIDTGYHGLNCGRSICKMPYYSGWFAYCADCGDRLTSMLVYMSKEAAESIDYLELQDGLDYYYLCPRCRSLEQGAPMGNHSCKAVSWNRYNVV